MNAVVLVVIAMVVGATAIMPPPLECEDIDEAKTCLGLTNCMWCDDSSRCRGHDACLDMSNQPYTCDSTWHLGSHQHSCHWQRAYNRNTAIMVRVFMGLLVAACGALCVFYVVAVGRALCIRRRNEYDVV